MPSYRRITTRGGDDSHDNTPQPQQPVHQCKPIIVLVSFLLYLNFSLLGHLTITDRDPRRYFREVFPSASAAVVGVRRSENYSVDGDNSKKGDVIEVQRLGNNNPNDIDKHHDDNGNDERLQQQQQSQQQQEQEEEKEEQNREWRLEGQIEIGKREKQKRVPSSFYRSVKSMVDVNEWWKTMEQKIQSGQKKRMKEQQQNNSSGSGNNNKKSESTEKGKIALIMSYPNSGTSYTSKLVRQASGTTTATNYGMEGLISTSNHKSVPVYDYSLDGPYWLHPPTKSMDDGLEVEGEDKQQTKRNVLPIPPSTASILTKTHCGIRCTHCPPIMYLENEETFFQRCLSGARKVPDKSKTNNMLNNNNNNDDKKKKQYYKKEYVTYSPNLIHSAIHLIRNPFDNAISRFHHELKERIKNRAKYQSWIDRYPRNSIGFRKWCNDENTMYGAYEREQFNWTKYGYSSDITKYFEGVSCHAEMVRYALWHALAIRTTERLDVPVMYLYYEDYDNDLEGETTKLLSFLNLTRSVDEEGNQVELPEFRQSDYSDYFTLEERAATTELIRRVLRDEKGIELLDRYFTEWSFQKLINETQDII